MTALVLRWTHYATPGLGVAVPAALDEVAKKGAGVDLATWRAAVLGFLGAAADLGSTPVAETGEKDLVVRVSPATRQDNAIWQRAIGNGIAALTATNGAPLELANDVDVTTKDGLPASISRPGVAGFPLLAYAAVVIVTSIVGAAVAYVTAVDAEVRVRELAADQKKSALAATLAEASKVVESHADRETAKGQSIPYTDGELSWLQALGAATRDVTGWSPAALQTTPDVQALSRAGAQAVRDVGSGFQWGVPLALLAGVYILSERR